ncbi:MAG: dephospho-CoA kinase [Chitinophagia bacterium]|nr:dephospho-CoA kinase [Chitinophagia bacterium]
MRMIGLTGGIGSGKTTVAKIFATLGIPVFNADETARQLMQNSPELKKQLVQQFGADVFQEGQLNKSYLSNLVFKDSYQLNLLNAIVHPASIQAAWDWAAQQNAPYVIKEAALIFESNAAEGLDRVIGVTAPTSLRVHRVMQRDKCSKADVEMRMRNQVSDVIKMKLCDWVIINNDQELLIPQVLKIHEALIKE